MFWQAEIIPSVEQLLAGVEIQVGCQMLKDLSSFVFVESILFGFLFEPLIYPSRRLGIENGSFICASCLIQGYMDTFHW
jgi:hypothetical protein